MLGLNYKVPNGGRWFEEEIEYGLDDGKGRILILRTVQRQRCVKRLFSKRGGSLTYSTNRESGYRGRSKRLIHRGIRCAGTDASKQAVLAIKRPIECVC